MKCFRWLFAFFLVLTSQVDARFPHGDPGAVQFTHVQIGGAGAVIGISSIPASNAFIARTDQFNCYLSISGSQWTPLLKTNNTPVGYAAIDAVGTPMGNGCDEGIFDPNNAQTIWLMANGHVFLSTDQGENWGNTCYPAQLFGDGYSFGQTPGLKSFSPLMAVDPANSNIVYMSLLDTGVSATYNKGVSCSTISSSTLGVASKPPSSGSSPAKGGYLIAFDSSGGTRTSASSPACPGGASICTANIYISTYGTGVYKSTDGGVNWTLTTSTPTTHVAMKADNLGNIWFLDDALSNGLGALKKYNGSAWSSPSVPALGVGLAVDPARCSLTSNCHIAVVLGGGTSATGTAFTVNGGSSWNVAQTLTVAAGDLAWAADLAANFSYYPVGAAFDSSGDVYTGGEGVYKVTPPAAGSGSAVTFAAFTKGIEESLSSSVSTSVATTGKVMLATWDVNCFVQLTMPYTSFPTTASNRGCYGTNGVELQHTYNVDWASSNSNFFIALTDNQAGYQGGGTYTNYSGTSTDGGVTWSALAAPPIVTAGVGGGALKGGCVAASSTTNYLWMPTDGSGGMVPPYYTTNSGTTWTPIQVTGQTEVTTTNATTAAGNATLHYASVPAGVVAGMAVYDDTAPATLQGNTTVLSVTSTTVVLDKTAQGAGVGSGDRVVFSKGGWGAIYRNRTHVCVSDRVTANEFYIYNWNDQISGDAVYKCTSGGASCSLRGRPGLGPDQQYYGFIKSVPDNAAHTTAGHLFLGNETDPFTGTGGQLVYSTDGGQNYTTVTGFTDVRSLGFGAPFSGHTYSTIVVAGWYNGVYGIWRSIDWDGGKTWQQIGPYPRNLGIGILDIDGDKVIPNVFYYTTNSGVFCSAPSTSYCNGGT